MFDVVAEKLERSNLSRKPFVHKRVQGTHNYEITSVIDFVQLFVDLDPHITRVVETTSWNDIESIKTKTRNIVNLDRLNEIPFMDRFFNMVNWKLPLGGIFICRAEVEEQRYNRMRGKFPKMIFYPYYLLDFIVNRILPKCGLTKKLYDFFISKNNKVLSLAHILGMSVFYGFNIIYLKDINNITHFVFQKNKPASYGTKPSSGFVFKMKRLGKQGKIINIYKLRTMHPYSEYIQDFMYNLNGSENGDKITDDFRVASWGKFLRKYWLDELPMLINLLKGDLKLVGVRPLSRSKFELYPPELQAIRNSAKPGLIPPFYADLPKTMIELFESERRYLESYFCNPFKTDLKYFYRCCYNILIMKARSS